MKEENSKLRANSVFFAIFDKTVAAINGLAQKIFNYFKNISGSSVICRFVNILLPKSIGGAFNSVSVILSGFFLLRLIILTIMHGPALNILTLNGGLALVFAAGALTPMENMGYAIKDSILAKLIEWFFVEE
jgi:hypothetical protein